MSTVGIVKLVRTGNLMPISGNVEFHCDNLPIHDGPQFAANGTPMTSFQTASVGPLTYCAISPATGYSVSRETRLLPDEFREFYCTHHFLFRHYMKRTRHAHRDRSSSYGRTRREAYQSARMCARQRSRAEPAADSPATAPSDSRHRMKLPMKTPARAPR